MDIRRFNQTQPFIQAVIGDIANALAETITARSQAVLAVPGGRTARALLPHLSAAPLPWAQIVITPTDERWVPVKHPDSNEGLVRSMLTGPAMAARVQGLFRHGVTAAQALPSLIEHTPEADVVLLGMGDDGHVASIFPYEAANYAQANFAVAARPDHQRVTMTPVALRGARRIVLAIAGAAKQSIFDQAVMDGALDALPVRHALAAGAAVFIGPESAH